MSDSRAMGGLERLPWLADEPAGAAAPAPSHRREVVALAAAAVAITAVGAFWIGSTHPQDGGVPAGARAPSATVTVPQPAPLPEVRIVQTPQVAPPPVPQVKIVRVPELRIVPMPAPSVRKSAPPVIVPPDVAPPTEKSASPKAVPTEAKPLPLTTWQPRQLTGAAGRVVQVGAFGSVAQAKQGWRFMVRAYPAMAHLPALVRPDRNSKGRSFYRFRIGTTSQAHSEVLCQRMRKIGLSCAVVGLPWKAKVER